MQQYDAEANLRYFQMARDFYVRQVEGVSARMQGYSSLPGGIRQAMQEEEAARRQQEEEEGSGGGQKRSTFAFVVYAMSILLVMAGSLSVWPGVTAFICSEYNPATVSPCAASSSKGRFQGDLWVPAMFLVFAIGDLSGRIISSWGPWGRRPPAALALLVYAIARFALAGAVLFCNVVTPSPWQLPLLFGEDYYPIAFILLLGFTQGHLLSTACMHTPAIVPVGKEAGFGPVTGMCITGGCLVGSIVSYFLVSWFTVTS